MKPNLRAAFLLTAATLAWPLAAQQTSRVPLNNPAERYIPRQVRRNLIALPFYGVFDYLSFQISGSTVTLLGQVTRPSVKEGAERTVKNVEGVEKVVNKIKVLPPSLLDDRIREAAYRAIYGQTALRRYALGSIPAIHIIVDKGEVTLLGVVSDKGDKDLAGIEANGVEGVFSVKNEIRVAKR